MQRQTPKVPAPGKQQTGPCGIEDGARLDSHRNGEGEIQPSSLVKSIPHKALTKNDEGDLVVMDIDAFTRREKMLRLREELLAVEEDRLAGRAGMTLEELDICLERVIDEVEHGKDSSL